MEKKVKVQVRDLTKKFGDLLVLNHMDFDVEEGDLLCVVGPTGCGKTTLTKQCRLLISRFCRFPRFLLQRHQFY